MLRFARTASRAFAIAALLAAASLGPAPAAAQGGMQVKLAIGGASCICYLPTVLAQQLGFYKEAGIELEMISFKGGAEALTAVLGGSADVVSGYYDHTIKLAAKGKAMQAIVVYGQFPGLVLVVAPKHSGDIKSVADLAGRNVGVSAPGSSTDFFLKYLLRKNKLDPLKTAVVGVGLGASAIAAMEKGEIQAAVMLDPAVTQLKTKYADLRLLADTRGAADTRAVFGGDYPGGSFYTTAEWVEKNPKKAQAMVDAMVMTLKWIHSHSAEEIAAKMPKDYMAGNAELYVAAVKNSLSMYSKTGRMDAKGAEAVFQVFAGSDPEVANAKVDVGKTYTNAFVEAAMKKYGVTGN
jgi:NitT/TauT family transport system substrate-binding protein